MKKRQHSGIPYFPRGPEIIPRAGTWQYEEYKNGRRFYEQILDGQRFPEGATPKQLDELAIQRRSGLARGAAAQVVAETAAVEQPAPVPMPELEASAAAAEMVPA